MWHRSLSSSDWSRLECVKVMKTGFEKAEGKASQCGKLLLAALLLFQLIALGQAQVLANPAPATIRPFKAHVPDQVLVDLRRRLAETKWPDQLPGTTWEYGADIKKVRELAEYWQNGYGWPGSILEFLALIEPLTDPKDSHSPAFDVVIPSLPGFGFSGLTTTGGWGPRRMAKALVVLMDRLGYPKYGIQGGDWGSLIARDMAYQVPTHVIGLHLNLMTADPPSPEAVAQMSDAERKRYAYFDHTKS